MNKQLLIIKAALEGVFLYCDLDGVLADFSKKYKELTGMNPEEYEVLYSEEEFWDVIDEYGTFWEELEWMPGGKELWGYIKQFDPIILTTPGGNLESCKKQKNKWVNQKLGRIPVKFSNNKSKFATSNSILIDDMSYNTEPFEEAGGYAILYRNVDETLDELNNILKNF